MNKFLAALLSFICAATLAAAPTDDANRLLVQSKATGGLIVHVGGGGDGTLAVALAATSPSFIVHAVDADSAHVEKARRLFRTSPSADRLSAEQWTGPQLPHAANLVNLLLVEAGQPISRDEAMRVLAPGGSAFFRKNGEWKQEIKPRGSGAADWTHYQFDAANNPVGTDPDCGLPRRFQWSGKPLWSAAHESMASLNAMVSANGRVFYIMDEGPRASIQLPPDWQLVARDAFNGAVLWKKPIHQWLTRFWPWKSGPAQMPRKLVAIGDRVYAPLDINGPLKQFDAATGRELRTYADTTAAEEIIYTDGILLVHVNPDPSNQAELEEERRKRRHFSYDGRNRAVVDHDKARRVVAVEAETGKTLWTRIGPRVSPLTLASLNQNVIYHDGERIVCLDLKTGREKWKSAPIAERLQMYSEESPTLVLHEKVVFYARAKKMTAVSMADGRELWKSPWTTDDYRSPVTVMLMNGLVWSMNITSARSNGTFTGRDPVSSEIREQFDLPPFKGIGHHRCYKAKASGDYVLLSRSGVEYVDPTKESYEENHWIRGACLYGILPANGMLYSTPHACACYIKGKLNGFTAMTPGPTARVPLPDYENTPTEKGPAFGKAIETRARAGDWPTYRGDVARSGLSRTTVTAALKQGWKTKLGGELSSLTVGEGFAFVAQLDRNTVHALNADTGQPAWSFTAGGKIDSPPTLANGRAYFGSGDGSIYCLRANDGALVWRTRAAPVERRVMAYNRVESAWPVNGSVLVQDGAVYAAAGRSSFLDGGIHIVKLDADTGELIFTYNVYDLESGKQPPLTSSFDMEGALPDILSGDGERVFMRHLSFDAKTLSPRESAAHAFSPAGYLDNTWWHRIYMVYGQDTKAGYGGWWQAGNKLPAGRILVNDQNRVYAFGRSAYPGMNAAQFGRGEKYILYAAEKRSGPEPDLTEINQARRRGEDLGIDWAKYRTTPIQWSLQIPFHVRGMAIAGDTLFATGPYGDAIRSMDSFTGARGVRIGAFSTADGRMLANVAIDALPVWDGLAAANGRLYAAMKDGTVQSFGASGTALESRLGEKVEELPEFLLPSDEEYREETRKSVGAPKAGKGKGKGKAKGKAQPAKRRPLKGARLESNFNSVTGGQAVAAPLGVRLGADDQQVALALNKLETPITSAATWNFRIKAAAGFPNPPYHQNGFFVFGDDAADESLIKCGFQFVQKKARIVQGLTTAQKGATALIKGDPQREFDVEVSVDLKTRKVTMTTAGQTLSANINRPLKSITHIGFAAWNAVTDFSAIESTAK